MYNLWDKLKHEGLAFIQAHQAELSALDCVELLLVDACHAEWIPFERLTPEAWLCLMKSCVQNEKTRTAFSQCFSPKLPWEIISKKMRRLIQREFPSIEIPKTPARAQIQDAHQIIYESPFDRTIFSIVPPGKEKPLAGCLKIYGIVGSLRGSYSGDYLTCGCGEPGCSGFWETKVHHSPQMIRLSLTQYEEEYDLFFDRETYERGAVQLLERLVLARWNGSEAYNDSYKNNTAFMKDVIHLFEEQPHLLAYWKGEHPILPSLDSYVD
ncbi:MAG: hypothetical protein IKW38_06315 [Kiritimatiellae bacterium]|nr:hypothetical protein [Kiritimatiellia bacterium]